MGSFWHSLGTILGSCWGHFHHAGTNEFHPKCCGADFGFSIKISGNLLGLIDQNFDIYPFDWSQVTSRGLAAEGEALTIKKRRVGCLSLVARFPEHESQASASMHRPSFRHDAHVWDSVQSLSHGKDDGHGSFCLALAWGRVHACCEMVPFALSGRIIWPCLFCFC